MAACSLQSVCMWVRGQMLQSVLLIDKARQNLHVSIRVAACLVNTPQIDRCVTTFALAVSDYTFQIDFQEATAPRFRLP